MTEALAVSISREIRVGDLVVSPPIAAAPMAGVTNQVFRRFARRFGAQLVYTEMISSMGLKYASARTVGMMYLHEEERPAAIQLFGGEPQAMADAARLAEKAGAAFIDINMACPVPKVTKGGGGAALLKDHDLALRIFSAVNEATDLPVTVKLRSGVSGSDDLGLELAEKLAEAGAAALALHPRSAVRRYSGSAEWAKIAELRRRITIPIWGSGDVFTAADALRMLDETGCDGVMIARGALGNFWIFDQVRRIFEVLSHDVGRNKAGAGVIAAIAAERPSAKERLLVSREFVAEMVECLGEFSGIRQARKHLLWLIKDVPGGGEIRAKVATATTPAELYAMIDEALHRIDDK